MSLILLSTTGPSLVSVEAHDGPEGSWVWTEPRGLELGVELSGQTRLCRQPSIRAGEGGVDADEAATCAIGSVVVGMP